MQIKLLYSSQGVLMWPMYSPTSVRPLRAAHLFVMQRLQCCQSSQLVQGIEWDLWGEGREGKGEDSVRVALEEEEEDNQY